MGQCRTSHADVTIGCYYGDYSSCDNPIPTSLYNRNNFVFAHTGLPPIIKVTASYCIASRVGRYHSI